MIKADIRGGREFHRAMNELSKEAQEAVDLQVKKIAHGLRDRVSKNYKSAGAGVVYHRIPGEKYTTVRAGSKDGPPVAFIPRGGPRNLSGPHQASRPGDYPAKDTGTLQRGVQVEQQTGRSFLVSTNIEYAHFLEYGTRKIKPRPNWTPETERARKEFRKLIEKVVEAAVRKRRSGR